MKYGNTNPWGLGPQNISSHSNPGHLGPREKFLTIQLGYTSICSAPAFTFVTKYWTEHCPLHAVVIFDNIIACQKQCSIFVASALVFISYYVCKVALCEECHKDSTKWNHQSKRAPPVISVA